MNPQPTLRPVEHAECVFCREPKPAFAQRVTLVSGTRTLIGTNKQNQSLFVRQPESLHTGPICPQCWEQKQAKVRGRRVLNIILSVLFWPIGIALTIAGFVFVLSEGGIQVGDWIITPYLFIIIACIPGFLLIALAYQCGKRGFPKPEVTTARDAETAFKKVVTDSEDAARTGTVSFAATLKEAQAIDKQNGASWAALKHPAAVPPPVQPAVAPVGVTATTAAMSAPAAQLPSQGQTTQPPQSQPPQSPAAQQNPPVSAPVAPPGYPQPQSYAQQNPPFAPPPGYAQQQGYPQPQGYPQQTPPYAPPGYPPQGYAQQPGFPPQGFPPPQGYPPVPPPQPPRPQKKRGKEDPWD